MQLVSHYRLGDQQSSFPVEELTVWDSYDSYMGLPKIHQRNLEDPTRVSSLFHWRTLQRLLSWTAPHISSPLSYSSEFVDSQCHMDRLFCVSGYTGSLDGFLEQRRFVEPGFKGCITVFCDEASLSKWASQKALIESTGVHAAVGYHPKNAHNSPWTQSF